MLTPHSLPDCRHSQFSKFPAFSLFVFYAATNKFDFRPIPWILHVALHVSTPLCVLSVTRYWVHSADDDPKIIPPEGWTTDKEELDEEFFLWGNNVAKNHGLKLPQPIMCNTPESGDCLYLFQSGSKYYLWNPIESAIWEIVTSMGLVDIVTEIDKPRLGSLKLARVYLVPSG